MRYKIALFAILLTIPFTQSCRMVDVLAGNERAGTVDRLWSDIPEVPGSKKADLAIPLGARLLIRTMMQGKVNFIAFTSDRTADQIKDIYSVRRMKAAGWTAHEAGCVGDSGIEASQGAVCLFVRPNDARENGLAIIVAEEPEKGETHIFYARFDLEQSDLRDLQRDAPVVRH
jgi:hypothetical protein